MPLPRRYSLSTEDIRYFFKTANKRLTFGYFHAYYKMNGLGSLRLSVSLGKKKFPKATARSKVKRLVYEAMRNVPNFLSYSFDVVIVPMPGIDGVLLEQLSDDLKKLFISLE